MQKYTRHPLSAAFPTMDEPEQSALTADIEQHGQRDPITIYDGMVLDGWHRYLSCYFLQRECLETDLPDDVDPVAFVMSHNLHRRHLTGSQRAIAVVSCNEWASVGKPKANVEPGSTLREMAKTADVSEKTIQQAKKADTAGLADKVRDGELSVKKAAEQSKPPKPPKLPKVTPPPEVQYEPVSKALLDRKDETIAELEAIANKLQADSVMTEKVFDADDKVAAAVAEIRQLKAQLITSETLLVGKTNAYNDLKQTLIGKDKLIDKLLKKIDALEKDLANYITAEIEK